MFRLATNATRDNIYFIAGLPAPFCCHARSAHFWDFLETIVLLSKSIEMTTLKSRFFTEFGNGRLAELIGFGGIEAEAIRQLHWHLDSRVEINMDKPT